MPVRYPRRRDKEDAVKSIRWIGALAGAVAVSYVGEASAQEPTQEKLVARSAAVTLIGSGAEKTLGRATVEDPVDPNANRRAGPGFEQATMVHLVGADKANYVVVLAMESVALP